MFYSCNIVALLCPVYQSPINVQNIFKYAFKIPVAEWVYERVERGVHVSEPNGEHVQVMVYTLSAESHDREGYEVRYPAQEEDSNDDAQLLRRLVLLVDPQALDTLAGMFDEPLPRLSQAHLVHRAVVIVQRGGVSLHI